jgi:hypothetical protein
MQRYVYVSVNSRQRIISSGTHDGDRSVRDVFVEIREDKKKFEHPIPLISTLVGLIVEAVHDGERVGEHCFEGRRVDRPA